MINDTVKDTMKAVRDVSTEDVLAALGLEKRRSTLSHVLPAVGYFAAGLAIGTGITLLMTPKTGRQMRKELGAKARDLRDQVESAAEKVAHDVQGRLVGNDAETDESLPMKRASGAGSSSSSNARKQ